MFWESGTILDYLVAGSAFILVLSVWLGGVLYWWSRRTAIKENLDERLGVSSGDGETRVVRLWHDGQEASASVAGASGWTRLVHRTNAWAQAMGWKVSGTGLLLGIGLVLILCAIVTHALTRQPLLTVAVPVTLGLLLNMYTQYQWEKHTKLFEEQFLGALQVATTSLRAGHPLSGAFRFVATEIDPPVGDLFAQVTQEQELGVGLEEALRKVAGDCHSEDMKLFATSVLVQIHSGGNLADMMERLGEVVRDRLRRRRRLRVLTAETQFSKRVLLAMPILVFVGMNVMRPEYMAPLYETTIGRTAIGAAIVLLLAGAWAMNRMAALE